MKRRTSKRPRRRGMTVILILGLLSITIALSYAMLRTQATSQQIQTNLNRRNDARQAAQTGLTVALRRMHEPNWPGVNVPVVGFYQDGSRYVVYYVVYETGDEKLSPADPDYDKFPYRVTLKSTGWVVTPGNSGINSMHTATAVVELVPRRSVRRRPTGRACKITPCISGPTSRSLAKRRCGSKARRLCKARSTCAKITRPSVDPGTAALMKSPCSTRLFRRRKLRTWSTRPLAATVRCRRSMRRMRRSTGGV